MGRNLTSLPISASFQYLLQKSGSEVNDGLGADVDYLNISASYAYTASVADSATSASYASTATSASHAVNSDTAISASFATTASYAENVATPTLQQVTTEGSGSTNAIVLENSDTSGGLIVQTSGPASDTSGSIFQSSGALTLRVDGAGSGGATSPDIVFFVNNQRVVDLDEEKINLLKPTAATAVTASAGFQGNLAGTASYADSALSSSYAITASYAENAAGADPFPYTGSADVTGSIELTGGPLLYTSTGGTLNAITDTNEGHFILGGYQNTISNGAADIGHGIMASVGSTISSNQYLCSIVGSNAGSITGGSQNGLFAASSATISSTQGINAIIGCNTSTISGTSTRSTILGGQNNSISAQYAAVIAGELNQVSAGTRGVVVGGYGNNEQGGNGAIFGGANNSTNTGQFVVVVGGSNNSITGTAENAVIVGGDGGSIVSHNKSVILGGTSLATTKAEEVVVPSLNINGDVIQDIGADNSIVSGATDRVVILASSGSSLTTTQPDNVAIIASKGCSITSTNTNSYAGGIFGAQSSTFGTGETRGSVILGGASNTMNGKLSAIVAAESCTVGSYSNFVGGGFNIQINGDKSAVLAGIGGRINGGTNNTLLGGASNQVNGSQNSIVAGSQHNIPTGVDDSAIVGGYNSDANHDRSVVLGGNALATSKADEVVVPHLTISGSATGDVYTITPASNTGSMDCSTGNFFTMTLGNAVDTRLEASNIQAGQTINLKLTNNATAAGTITFGPEFEFVDGTAFTATAATSAVDVMTFISFDGTSLQATGLKNFS